MNKRFLTLFLVSAFVFALAISTGFAAEPEKMMPGKMMDKAVVASVDKVLKMAPDNAYFRFSLQDLKAKVDAAGMDFVIVDVRPANLFQAEHIVGSVSIPLPILADSLSKLPMEKTIYVVCAVDSNSAYAAFALRMFGYKAFMVPGGEVAWKQAGYPVEASPEK